MDLKIYPSFIDFQKANLTFNVAQFQRRFHIRTMGGREIYILLNVLGMTHANRHRAVGLETLPSNLPNVQLCCLYFDDTQSSSCEIIISQLTERKTCQQFLHAHSWYIVVLEVRHTKRRSVVALETLPSNLPNVQLCCVYFDDNQSSSCEIITSQLRERKTCQQFLHALSWYIVGLAVRSNYLLSQQSAENQLDAFKVRFVWYNSFWGLAKGSWL